VSTYFFNININSIIYIYLGGGGCYDLWKDGSCVAQGVKCLNTALAVTVDAVAPNTLYRCDFCHTFLKGWEGIIIMHVYTERVIKYFYKFNKYIISNKMLIRLKKSVHYQRKRSNTAQ
jgi:hypothetical protein